MRESEKSRFAVLVSDVLGYYRLDASKFTLQLWWEAFQAFEYDQVSRAISAHVQNPDSGEFPIKIAHVTRILQGTKTEKSAMAWAKAYGSISSIGAYSDVVFDDPAIHAVIEDMGGWPKFCRDDDADLSYRMHRFCEAYKAYVGRMDGFAYPKRLSGDRAPDSEYERWGHKLPKPAIVGEVEVARQVYQRGGAAGKANVAFKNIGALVLDVVAKPMAQQKQLEVRRG